MQWFDEMTPQRIWMLKYSILEYIKIREFEHLSVELQLVSERERWKFRVDEMQSKENYITTKLICAHHLSRGRYISLYIEIGDISFHSISLLFRLLSPERNK